MFRVEGGNDGLCAAGLRVAWHTIGATRLPVKPTLTHSATWWPGMTCFIFLQGHTNYFMQWCNENKRCVQWPLKPFLKKYSIALGVHNLQWPAGNLLGNVTKPINANICCAVLPSGARTLEHKQPFSNVISVSVIGEYRDDSYRPISPIVLCKGKFVGNYVSSFLPEILCCLLSIRRMTYQNYVESPTPLSAPALLHAERAMQRLRTKTLTQLPYPAFLTECFARLKYCISQKLPANAFYCGFPIR